MRKTVAFGFVGTVLDYVGRGSSAGRNGGQPYACVSRKHWLFIALSCFTTPVRAACLRP